MKVIYNVDNYKVKSKGKTAVWLSPGNFDGIHLAHRKILEKTKDNAKGWG